uniref:Uncharacterized protein n=1 Tax=Babesia bovis TaxID=5865 RepID=S6B3H1_BABBO|nr:hypothetical protein [Babesia bovis]
MNCTYADMLQKLERSLFAIGLDLKNEIQRDGDKIAPFTCCSIWKSALSLRHETISTRASEVELSLINMNTSSGKTKM